MKIELNSGELRVKKIANKTRAKMFAEIEVGDILEISIPVAHVGSNGSSTYAPELMIRNSTKKQSVLKTFNEAPKLLACFKFEKVK